MPYRIRALLVALGVEQSQGWTTVSQAKRDPVAESLSTMQKSRGAIFRLWDFPDAVSWGYGQEPIATIGRTKLTDLAEQMGGAIPYAFDPSMCTVLDQNFGYNLWGVEFDTCGEIAQAIRSAFDAWSRNHPRVHFADMTNECLALQTYRAVNSTGIDSTPCKLARIWLTTTNLPAADDNTAVTAGEYKFKDRWRHTNGRWATMAGYVTERATIAMRRQGTCFYLDDTFCAPIHQGKKSVGAATLLIAFRILLFAIFGIVLADVVMQTGGNIRRQLEVSKRTATHHRRPSQRKLRELQRRIKDSPNDCERKQHQIALNQAMASDQVARKRTLQGLVKSMQEDDEYTAILEELEQANWVAWGLRIFFLIAPLVVSTMLVDPCFSCYDFQAAVTKQVGHVLGIGNADLATVENIMISRTGGEQFVLNVTKDLAAITYGSSGRIDPIIGYKIDRPDETQDGIQGVQSCGGYEACLTNGIIDCWNPWQLTVVQRNMTSTNLTNLTAQDLPPVMPSVMETLGFDNPRRCLEQDDLDALNVLYPVCIGAQTYPVCPSPANYRGFIRLAVHIGVPLLITLFCMAMAHHLLLYLHRGNKRNDLRVFRASAQDPAVQLRWRDGEKMPRAEGKALMLEVHLKTLQKAKRTQLMTGKRSESVEVRAVDEQIRRIQLRIAKLRGVSGAAVAESVDEDEAGFFRDLLTPARALATKVVHASRHAGSGHSAQLKSSRIYAAPDGLVGADSSDVPKGQRRLFVEDGAEQPGGTTLAVDVQTPARLPPAGQADVEAEKAEAHED